MGKIKDIIKAVTPPLIVNAFKKPAIQKADSGMWSGHYANWAAAKSYATGYDDSSIMEKCKDALLKVKNGEAVYERDSVLFDTMQYNWALLAQLQKIALENDGKLCVVDFGGSLGSTYYQNREFLKGIKQLSWCILEQEHFVECGKQNFEDGNLKFYHSMEECLQVNKPSVLLLSSVLQYLPNPKEWITSFLNYSIPYIIIDRTAFINDTDRLSLQKVDESIYDASYPSWFFNEASFIEGFSSKYAVITGFDNEANPTPHLSADGKLYYWKGFFLKQK